MVEPTVSERTIDSTVSKTPSATAEATTTTTTATPLITTAATTSTQRCQLRSGVYYNSARTNDSGSNIVFRGDNNYNNYNYNNYDSNVCSFNDSARDYCNYHHYRYHYGHPYHDHDNYYCHFHHFRYYYDHDHHHYYYKVANRVSSHVASFDQDINSGVKNRSRYRAGPNFEQFKSKIRSSVGGSIGASRADDNPDDYEMYSDLFRPPVHDSGFPAIAAASSMAGSSPQMQHMHYEQQPYEEHSQQLSPTQQQHMSLSATSTVPDYSQYRQQGQERWVDDGYGYDAVVNEAIMGTTGGPYHPPTYASQDNGAPNDHFLRELRE
ncbi:hypothetical protein BGZ68_007491 [Mortierella alpina]|nr:hypothetical protein BGZ68_007491 [Mortierella alpina]